jgi:hypothetical protein
VSTRDRRKTLSLRTTAISMADILTHTSLPRKTKIVCTMGPASNTKEGLEKLLDAGMNTARFNFSHGKHADHQQVNLITAGLTIDQVPGCVLLVCTLSSMCCQSPIFYPSLYVLTWTACCNLHECVLAGGAVLWLLPSASTSGVFLGAEALWPVGFCKCKCTLLKVLLLGILS